MNKYQNMRLSPFDDKIPLGIAATIFIVLMGLLSEPAFIPRNFCLMNKNDPICVDERNDCLEKASSNEILDAFGFGFGTIVEINSTKTENAGIGLY